MNAIKYLPLLVACSLLPFAPSLARASGMVPATSVVLIDEADGESTMQVKNTDDKPALLYTIVEHVPDDKETLFTVTPPIARVDPGQTQLVRFILTNRTPLKTERLARVIFDSIGERKDPSLNTVSVRIRQNLPVIIHPKGMPIEREPWKRLKWRAEDGKLRVTNDSPYVVRLGATLEILPMKKPAMLPNTYILPGQSTYVMMPKGNATPAANGKNPGGNANEKAKLTELLQLYGGATSVKFQPATSYGYVTTPHQASIDFAVAQEAPASPAAASNSGSKAAQHAVRNIDVTGTPPRQPAP